MLGLISGAQLGAPGGLAAGVIIIVSIGVVCNVILAKPQPMVSCRLKLTERGVFTNISLYKHQEAM